MIVYTLSPDKLISTSKLLAQQVIESSWQPELIIGVKTGGAYVAEPFYNEVLKHHQALYNTVSLSRPSTSKKKKFKVSKILKLLPYFILDILRNIEVFLFEINKSKEYTQNREKHLILNEELKQQIISSKRILLVDDAIDTGSTILAIKNRFYEINSNLELRIAVLTITHKDTYIGADYSLYKRVLLRCPWSDDYKNTNHD